MLFRCSVLLLMALQTLVQGQSLPSSNDVPGAVQTCPHEPQGVTLAEIPDGIASGELVLVDVRTHRELLETGKIPGSYNIPLNTVSEAFALSPEDFEATHGFAKPPPERLVFTCRSGRRATTAWRKTERLGYCDARVYFGSFLEWSASEQPIESITGARSGSGRVE